MIRYTIVPALIFSLTLVGCGIMQKMMGGDEATAPVATVATPAETGSSEKVTHGDLSGTYSARGTNPGGAGTYSGTAIITKEGDGYRIDWSVGIAYQGRGKIDGGVFRVVWGTGDSEVGTVTYSIEADGSLKGTWSTNKDPGNLGTEILTRIP